jgi:glycosyltransferase involved in cell wall biosynthesis
VICVSEDLQKRCRECGVPEERCVLVENGIDTEQYTRRRTLARAKEQFGLPPERFVIGAVGRLSPEKGFDLLLRAAQRLLAAGQDVAVLIAGEGDEKTRLEALARELGLSERVRLLGYCADTCPVYEAMDVYALSSRREGLPNVLLEAMAMEVSIVATRIAGVPRLLGEQENGLLVEPESVDDLVHALTRLRQDKALSQALRQSGRHTVETRYSFAGRIQKLRELYDNLLCSADGC